MFFRLFAILPLAELVVFVIVAQIVGWGHALLFCVAGAALGTLLIWRQGLRPLLGARGRGAGEGFGADEVFNGACLSLAGLLLIMPGFLTDILALMLLLPRLRRRIWRGLTGVDYGARPDDGVIEGEYVRVAAGRLEEDPREDRQEEPPAKGPGDGPPGPGGT